MSKPTIVPFVKWVGGKRQILDELIAHLPANFNTYFEPFIGGGALFLTLQPTKAVVGDINAELINAYKMIKKNPRLIHEYLTLMQWAHTADFYEKVKSVDQANFVHDKDNSLVNSNYFKAARFVYLNKACFNGLYRVNSQGFFNVPLGNRTSLRTHSLSNILELSAYLKNSDVKIFTQDFHKIAKLVKRGDFVYFDPPYDYEISGFDQYSSKAFGKAGQKRLAAFCAFLDGIGVHFMVSNHNTDFIRQAYRDFNIHVIRAWRLVGGKGSKRSKVEEVIITNYEPTQQK